MTIPLRDAGTVALAFALLWGLLILIAIFAVAADDARRQRARAERLRDRRAA